MWRAWVFVLTVAACGDNRHVPPADAPSAPAFRHPVALPDTELAAAALNVLDGACSTCHGLTQARLRYWGQLSDTALATCLTDLAVSAPDSARAMIDCTRATPADPATDFQTRKLGIFATAVQLPWFVYAFDTAYGGDARAQLTAFHDLAGMPRGATSLTQDEFDVVAEWFIRGLPALAQTLGGDPPPSSCTPSISSAVASHTTAMSTQGWRALDRATQLAMHGCGSATDPRDCLTSYPLAVDQPFGVGWDVAGRGRIRVLRDEIYVTSFWTRSSADGRFVAHGVASVPGSYVIDLQRDATIPIAADYDPAFFPDNSGFVFQGGPANTCALSVLTANPSAISMTEPGCRAITQIGLYQHAGAMLAGGDHITLDALFVSDDGGKLPTLSDPLASFTSAAYSAFTPLVFDGSTFVPRAKVSVVTPFEGDTTMSPSTQLTIARLAGPGDVQLGYVLREIMATPDGSTYAITAPEIARYCMTGGKPEFSYDERWVAFHRYVTASDAVELGFQGPGDPAFAPYLSAGAANIYVMDLSTGVAQRVTTMHPGQYALFPHFRADGWIYAQVRDANAGHEYTIASDATLVLE
ncbi:MAG TPA: hypothetical protein VGM90_03970 [Kofleriaceae bacterium]